MKIPFSVFALLLSGVLLDAQSTTLRGIVTDESGAIVPRATVTLAGPAFTKSTKTSSDGSYAFSSLPAGDYSLEASAPGLALPEPVKISLKSASQVMLNLELKIAQRVERVNVGEDAAPTVATDPATNASALVMRGQDLDALADDPANLEADLQALAGPAAGPGGGAIYVDGFSGGQLPSKDSIREIRINQNPFAPEYDKLGLGRVEIFTKPGADKYRGTAFYNLGLAAWNSRNPYAAEKAPFFLREYGGNVGGPLNKRASFFADVRRDATDNGAILNGVNLDPATFAVTPFTDTYRVRQRAVRFGPRIDYQINTNHTLTVRYNYFDMDIPGAGIGGFNLASRGYDAKSSANTLQVSETAVLHASVVNEIRFSYYRSPVTYTPFNAGPSIQVAGAFTSGGASIGNSSNTERDYEFQDYVSVVHGTHTWRMGVRFRSVAEDTVSPQNFNGTFSFFSIEQYQRTVLFSQQGLPPTRIRELGGGASQFTQTAGEPALAGSQSDVGVFVGDDWRVRSNLTLSLGARYETQTNLHDWRDFAPRLGMAWSPKTTGRKTVLRAGYGMFYDRFALANTLTAQRYNGTRQIKYVVEQPGFFPQIPAGLGSASSQIVERISSSLRAPYIMQSALGFERQLPWGTTVALTYANSHGLHLLRSRNVNAPIPGTGLLPNSDSGPIFLMESAGLYNQNQFIANINSKVNKNVSLNASYMLNRALSNTDGVNTFPANQYDLAGEYGPASTDIRNRFSLAGSVNSKWDVRFSPLVVLQSGAPFEITSGEDLYGTTLFNARPGIASDSARPGLVQTPYGLLDPLPASGEAILGRNAGRGPGLVRINLRVSKTVGFGRSKEAPAGAPPPNTNNRNAPSGPFSTGGALAGANSVARRYNLVISMSIDNLINHNNPGPIIGNIKSRLFGLANQPAGARDLGGGGFSESANNRRLELQLRLNF